MTPQKQAPADSRLDRPLGHAADNDGIDEFDNPLPAWWLGLLWLTVATAIAYTVDYHFISPRSQVGDYAEEVAEAKARVAASAEVANVSAATVTGANAGGTSSAAAPGTITPELVEAGKAVYSANCVGCHGTELKGGVGPNLTDKTWIHGGSLDAITHTVTNGVPEKGMLTWGPILGPQKIAQVAAYVHEAGGGE